MEFDAGRYDVAVIGAGHAGIEAGLACARMGLKTVVFTINLDAVGNMPCNPAIGGTGKGHDAGSDIGASLCQLAIHQCLEYVLRILLVVHNPRRIPDGVALGHHVGTNRIQLYTLCHQRVDIKMAVQT